MGWLWMYFCYPWGISDNFILEYFRILRLFGVMDRHTVSRQISMSMVGNSKFGEKVVKGPLIFADCQKILLKLLQPELLFRGWLSHERALHTRSINGMSHTEAVERKQFSAAFNRVCFASMFYIYPFYCMLWNQKFVLKHLREDNQFLLLPFDRKISSF